MSPGIKPGGGLHFKVLLVIRADLDTEQQLSPSVRQLTNMAEVWMFVHLREAYCCFSDIAFGTSVLCFEP